MGFKHYLKVVTCEEAKALVREGAQVFGSIRELKKRLKFSLTHVYRWSNAESRMLLKDFNEIKAIITKEKKRRENQSC